MISHEHRSDIYGLDELSTGYAQVSFGALIRMSDCRRPNCCIVGDGLTG